ncbi:MAG: hypothetical protein WAP23_01875 [Candidatus Spechtbacterales bacterium]
MSRKSEKRGGTHHIIPSSRGGGGGDNIFPDDRWPNGIGDHLHWHTLVGNLRPDEVVRKIGEYTNRDGTLNEGFFEVRFKVLKPWKDKDINPNIKEVQTEKFQKRKDAWQALFGDMKVREVIKWIEREFIRKEWLTSP